MMPPMPRSALSLVLLAPLCCSPLWAAEPAPATSAELLANARDQDLAWQQRRASLRSGLTSSVSEVRIQSIEAIADLQDPALAGDLLPFLETATPPEELAAACLATAHLGNAAAIPSLRIHLTHASPDVRQAAYQALEHLSGSTPQDHLGRANDSDPVLRDAAIVHLALFPVPEAAPILVANLARNSQASMRRLCALGLGRLGDRAQGPVLQKALIDGDATVRQAVADALVRLRYTPAIPALFMTLENPMAGDGIARCLTKLAGKDFGYQAKANETDRKAAIDRGWAWWTANAARLNH